MMMRKETYLKMAGHIGNSAPPPTRPDYTFSELTMIIDRTMDDDVLKQHAIKVRKELFPIRSLIYRWYGR